MKIQAIDSFENLASALGVTTGHLRRLVFKERQYFFREKEIPKKNGETRKIHVPNNEILYIQKKLNIILNNSYNPHFTAFGFIEGKSIVDNAQRHLRKRYLLNIDLKDFFTSISSGRVYSMFVNYFKIPSNIASVLTNICCHPDGFLPQGAPTSPTISNILCKTLDRELHNFTKKLNQVTYTRYADDITFSSNNLFEKKLLSYRDGKLDIGYELDSIIQKNGFFINYDKVRYQQYNQHQEVTGIVVNQKLNVNRKYIRKIRAMLHSIESNPNDLTIPTQKFANSDFKGNTLEDLFRTLKGMIEYIGMVKGKNDSIFIKFAKQINELLVLIKPSNIKPIYYKTFESITYLVPLKKLVLFNSDTMDNPDYGQGSAFLLKNIGIISNYHVFEFIIKSLEAGLQPPNSVYCIEIFQESEPRRKIKVKIEKYSKENDLVLLIPEDESLLQNGFDYSEEVPNNAETTTLLGFPDYNEGDQLKSQQGDYIRTTRSSGKERYEISQTIFGGNSGGPVLNLDGKVFGVATEGLGTDLNLLIPIKYIHDMQELNYTKYEN